MKKYFKILPLVLLGAAIAFCPSFSVGRLSFGKFIEIRVEDILLLILGLVWIANFLISGRKKLEKPPLFLPILAWLTVGFFSVLTNWIFANIDLDSGFFYFLKEVEFFFLYFYLFYHIKKIDTVKFLVWLWLFFGVINVAWIIFEIISGLKISYHYGPTAFMEPGAPFPSGGFFLILFIFLFNILLHYYLNLNISKLKKGIISLGAVAPALGVFSSGSRASFLGLIFALILTFLFYSIKKGLLKSFFLIIIVLVLIASFFIFFQQRAMERFLNMEGIFQDLNPKSPGSRPAIWISQLSEAVKHPLFLFFGFGKSVLLVYGESHSQYVRNLVETGIVGSIIFLFLIFAVIRKSWIGFSKRKDPFLIGISSGLLVASLTMLFVSIAVEAFIIVKIAEVFWFFAALTMLALYFHKKSIHQNLCVE